MVEKREAFAPWSLTRKAGGQSATVNSDIEVPQFIQPVLTTGFVDEKGDWKGSKSSDEQFIAFGYDEAIPNGGEILAPQATGSTWPLDMTGFTDMQIAIKPTNGGNYAIAAVMGPADFAYANLKPVNAANDLKGISGSRYDNVLTTSFNDSVDALTADVWNIFMIQLRLKNQKLLQFKIINNSGGESTIETAFLRLV